MSDILERSKKSAEIYRLAAGTNGKRTYIKSSDSFISIYTLNSEDSVLYDVVSGRGFRGYLELSVDIKKRDQIICDGVKYDVKAVSVFNHGSLPHKKVIIQRLGEELVPIPSSDATITLNSESFLTVPAGTTQDIVLQDEESAVIVPASVVGNVITVDKSAATFVRIYNRPLPTGQATIYEDYDDAWKVANNVDTYDRPLDGVPMEIQRDKIWKLINQNNIFEHFFRWTGLTGGYYNPEDSTFYDSSGVATTESLAFPDAYVIDHYTGLAFMNARLGQSNFTDILSEVNSYSAAGFSDFYLPNMNEAMSVMNFEERLPAYNELPFDNWGGTQKHTCTTYNASTGFNWQQQLQGHVQAASKTSSKFGIPMRYHFT